MRDSHADLRGTRSRHRAPSFVLLSCGLFVTIGDVTREDDTKPGEGCWFGRGGKRWRCEVWYPHTPQSGTTYERAGMTIRTAVDSCLLHIPVWLRSRCGVGIARSARSQDEAGTTRLAIGGANTVKDQDLMTRGYPWPSTRKRITALLAQCVEFPTVLDLRPGPWPCADFPYLGDMARLVSLDPSADRHGSLGAPPASEVVACAEELFERFDCGKFDLVFARDWVDRCRNPQQVIRQMLRVVKPGGFVLMEHRLSSVEQLVDGGLQRWGLSVDSAGGLDFRFQEGEIRMSHELGAACQIECELVNPGEYWLIMMIRKNR